MARRELRQSRRTNLGLGEGESESMNIQRLDDIDITNML